MQDSCFKGRMGNQKKPSQSQAAVSALKFCTLHPKVQMFPIVEYKVRWTPHPGIVTMRDNRNYNRVLLHAHLLIIPLLQGWGGGPLKL